MNPGSFYKLGFALVMVVVPVPVGVVAIPMMVMFKAAP
jgi:hypothetical protein